MSKKDIFISYVLQAGVFSAILIVPIFLVGLALKAGDEYSPSSTSTNSDGLYSTWRCWKSSDGMWDTLDYGYPRSQPGGSDSNCQPVK